jgi:hypothetical protein
VTAEVPFNTMGISCRWLVCFREWPVRGGTGAVIGIQFWPHQTQRGEAAGHVANVAHLGRIEHAAEQWLLAV